MSRKTYKKARKYIEESIEKDYPQYKGFEIKFWGSRMFIRDPRGCSFGIPFTDWPVYGFDIMPEKDGTLDYPNRDGKYSWGGYKVFLKPDDYKTGRGRKPWIEGDRAYLGCPN